MVNIIKNYEGSPSEDEIKDKLAAEGLSVSTWSFDAGTVKEPEAAGNNRVICVIDGMVRFTLPDSPEEYADLMSGDRIEIPAGTKHGLMSGPAGVKAVEGN